MDRDVSSSHSRLPPLPAVIAVPQRRVEVTDKVLIAWDVRNPWGITGVAFLRDANAGFTAWTPGHPSVWVWRGPRYIPKESAGLLAKWLIQGQDSAGEASGSGVRQLAEVTNESVWLWDPDPHREGGVGFLRCGNGEFQLSLMMMGLVRGRANIGREDAQILARWLMRPDGATDPVV